MRRCVDTYVAISQGFGVSAPSTEFGKHLGVDYAGPEDRDVKAPVSGVITQSYLSAVVGNLYELKEDGNGRLHRLMHLKVRPLGVGVHVAEGQVIGKTGGAKGASYSGSLSTGPHCHHDVRKANTKWDASFDNYMDWEKILAEANKPPVSPNANLIGKSIQLIPIIDRTTFRAGTTVVAGTIHAKDNSYVYLVRGVDPKYPNRVIINSASAGGDGVALALQYVSGTVIPGWKVV